MNWRAYWNRSAFVFDGDPCRQVGKTFHGVPYSPREIDATVERLISLLRPGPGQQLLELACGNGMLTSRVAEHFDRVTAVDFSAPLIDAARRTFARQNVEYVLGDALGLGLEGPFSRVLMHCAFQYFSPEDAGRLLALLRRVLASDGIAVLGDVADGDRIWNFYRGISGRARFAIDAVRRRPIIGHWWRPSALRRLAARSGFDLDVRYQEPALPNHYFRYDAVLVRA